MTYTLYGTPLARPFRVVWMFNELGLPFEHKPLPPHAEDVWAVHGSGKVPVLVDHSVDGDLVISDSAAILTYLADKHEALTHPAGTPGRAIQDSWTFRILDELDGVLWTAARHSFVLPEDKRIPEVRPVCFEEISRSLAAMAKKIEGPYLMGETFTVPDILMMHCLGWAANVGITVFPEPITALQNKIAARTGFQRAAEIRDAARKKK